MSRELDNDPPFLVSNVSEILHEISEVVESRVALGFDPKRGSNWEEAMTKDFQLYSAETAGQTLERPVDVRCLLLHLQSIKNAAGQAKVTVSTPLHILALALLTFSA
jgi:hypothetical protein